jgi:pyruvate,water dikinase
MRILPQLNAARSRQGTRREPTDEHAFFSEIGIGDVALVGGKNASLDEMYKELTALGILVPNGFAVTAEGYRRTLDEAGAWKELTTLLAGIDKADIAGLARRADAARELALGCPLPQDLVSEVRAAYGRLAEEYGESLSVAVRSSATAEDLPTASFAGQHESYLNTSGEVAALAAIRRCYASLFTDRAIRYRIDNGFDHLKVFNSAGIMKMVRSDLAIQRHIHYRYWVGVRRRRLADRSLRPRRNRGPGHGRS